MVRYADSAEGDLQRELARADDNGMTQPCGAVGATGALPGWSEPPPDGPQPGLKQSLLDGMTSAQRKEYPITTGCLDYFRDALLYISHVSYKGNQKHNPGEPLHWARGKSTDEPDALGRHLVAREIVDDNGLLEAGEMAWRALALLQKLLETKYNIKPPPGAK